MRRPELSERRFSLRTVAGGQHDGGPERAELTRRGLADARIRAGDDDGLAGHWAFGHAKASNNSPMAFSCPPLVDDIVAMGVVIPASRHASSPSRTSAAV